MYIRVNCARCKSIGMVYTQTRLVCAVNHEFKILNYPRCKLFLLSLIKLLLVKLRQKRTKRCKFLISQFILSKYFFSLSLCTQDSHYTTC